MATILHIDSSPRRAESVSRKLSREFVERWSAAHPEDRVVYRDLTKEPAPFVTAEWVTAAFTAPEQRTAEQRAVLSYSDAAVDELLAADVIVIGAPMHNFNISSHLKAYIDQIARAGRTFSYGANGLEGLAKGKKLFVITSRGSNFGAGSPLESLNHQTPYLKTFFAFIGIDDVTFINAEAQSIAQQAPTFYDAALSQVQQLAI